MLKREYLTMNGRVYEVVGKDGKGFPVCQLTDLKEIPEDKPLKKTEEAEEEKPKRGRKKA
jgi:hypothetical protein